MDPFSTLGVARSCSGEDIKTAFRKLALQLHPDRLQSESDHVRQAASTRFKAVTEAYEILSDDTKRAALQRGAQSSASAGQYSQRHHSGGYAYGYGSGAQYQGAADANWWNQWQSTGTAGPRKVRRTLWHTLTKSLSMRPLEVAFFATLAGLAGVGVWGIDSLWAWRNQGRRFEDIQRSRPSHSLMDWSAEQQQHLHQEQQQQQQGAAPAAAASVGGPAHASSSATTASTTNTNSLRNFVPTGCGVRSKQYSPSFQGVEGRVSDLSLSQLVQLEDEAAAASGGLP